jgi:hypothetical protein
MQADVHVVEPVTGERISPATEGNLTDLVNETKESVSKNSLNFGTQRLTIDANGVAVGANQACREVWISFQTTNDVHLAVQESGDADANDFLLPPNVIIPVPARNTSKIRIFGTAADFVYLMWRD